MARNVASICRRICLPSGLHGDVTVHRQTCGLNCQSWHLLRNKLGRVSHKQCCTNLKYKATQDRKARGRLLEMIGFYCRCISNNCACFSFSFSFDDISVLVYTSWSFNRKGICEFLLVINSNLGPIFAPILRYGEFWPKNANFPDPTVI